MANQKVYNIVINGIKESISEVDILLNQLDNLEKRLKNLGKEGIKLDTKGLKDLEKIKIPEISIEGIDAKALKKEMQQLEKDIAKGAKTIDGEYTNTLNGLRAKLRDLKGELGTLDLDVDGDAFADLTDEIKELNDRVKEMEQDYGTFSRNVGNYTDSMVDALNEFDGQVYETAGAIEEVKKGVDSLKGKQMFDVNIGGVAVQFENVSQAIGEIDDMAHAAAAKMQELANAGKTNTEEYKKLNQEFQEFIQTSANLERVRKQTDELRDSVASTSRGLDMGVQAFQALGNAMQMASGIAGLFGDNQGKIEEAINRTVQIQAILQSAQELYNQTIQNGTVLNKVWTVSLAATDKVMKMLGVTTTGTSKAFKLLRGAIAASGIGLLAILAADAVSALMEMVNGLSKSERKLLANAQAIDRIKESTNDWLDEIERLNKLKVDLGLIDEIESTTDLLAKYKAEYNLTIQDILTQNKKLEGKWGKLFEIDTKKLDVDKANIIKLLSDLSFEYISAKDIVDKYKQAIEDGSDELNEDTIATYQNAQAKVVLYNSLSRVMEGYNQYLNAVNKNNKNDNGGKNNSSGKTQAEIRREIEDAEVAAMKDGFSKRMAELKLQQKRELEDAGKNEKLRTALLAKHQREREKLTEQHNKEIKELKYEIEKSLVLDSLNVDADVYVESLNNTYRRIDELSEKLTGFRKEWLKIQDETILTSKGIIPDDFGTKGLSTFEKFTLKLKDFWRENVTDVLSGDKIEHNINKLVERISSLKQELFSGKPMDNNVLSYLTEYDAKEKKSGEDFLTAKRDTDILKNEKEYYEKLNSTLEDVKGGDITYDQYETIKEELEKSLKEKNDIIEKDYIDNMKKIEEHYEQRNTLLTKYSSREIGIILQAEAEEKKILQQEHTLAKREEEIRYNEELDRLTEAQNKQLERTDLTEKERKEIIAYWEKQFSLAEENHQNNLLKLRMEFGNRQLDIEKNTQIERSKIITQYNDIIYEEYSKAYDDILKLQEDFSNVDEVDLGSQELSVLGGFSSSIMEMNKFEDSFKKMKENISKQKEELIQQFNDGVITEEAFNKSYAELDLLEEEVNNTLSNISLNFKEWSVGIAEVTNAVVGIWATMYSQIADLQYQNEMKRIDDLREQYDKETEILREALEEQKELFEQHNQNVSDIEGELQTARGDRRLFLLDQINSEMQKREQAWAQQQKIAKQQEQLEKKKIALEERQKAAEQKRNKQNQKVQVAQATASTALAVTNALAVQPWFLGVALAAVAAAMGAVQIATIKKQKFADGGVIQGASHANGGVKILNGQAEVEGGEYITNKVTTSKNVDVLTFINSKKKKLDLSDFVEFYSNGSNKNYSKPFKTVFANGGQLPSMNAPSIDTRAINSVKSEDNRPIYVSVTEIENVQNKVRNVRAIAGLEN